MGYCLTPSSYDILLTHRASVFLNFMNLFIKEQYKYTAQHEANIACPDCQLSVDVTLKPIMSNCHHLFPIKIGKEELFLFISALMPLKFADQDGAVSVAYIAREPIF